MFIPDWKHQNISLYSERTTFPQVAELCAHAMVVYLQSVSSQLTCLAEAIWEWLRKCWKKRGKNTGNQQGQWQCENNFGRTAFLAEQAFSHRTLSDQSQNTSIMCFRIWPVQARKRERQKELWLFLVNTGSAVALWTDLRGSGCDTGQSRQLFQCDSELMGKSVTSLIQFFLKSPFSKSYRLETKLDCFTFSKENELFIMRRVF